MIRLLLSALMLAFWACSHPQTAGVITETTNGISVAGAVKDSSGRPYAGLAVSLRSAGGCGACDSLARTTRTDSAGRYAFDSVPTGVYVVYARVAEAGALAKSITIAPGDSGMRVGDSLVRATTELSGIARAPGASGPITVSVAGTDLSALSDATGRFRLERLPQADLLLRLTAAGGARLTVPVAAARGADTLALDTAESTLLEDFDDGDVRHLLAPYLDGGNWYARADSGVTVDPAGMVDDAALGFQGTGAFRNRSLVAAATFPADPADGGLFLAALELSTGLTGKPAAGRWFDFSRMRALSFMARGSGTLHVVFMTKAIYEGYGGESHFEASVKLTPEWKEHVILPQDIAPPLDSPAAKAGKKWPDAAAFVAELGFFGGETISLGLDDIRIRGISTVEFLSPDPKR